MMTVKMEKRSASNTRQTNRMMVHGVGEPDPPVDCPQMDGHSETREHRHTLTPTSGSNLLFQSFSMQLMKCRTAITSAWMEMMAMYIWEWDEVLRHKEQGMRRDSR